MKTVVITGSTRGIGLALVSEFVRQGHNAVVSGRSQSDCDQVVSELTGQLQSNQVIGVACDVRDISRSSAALEYGGG